MKSLKSLEMAYRPNTMHAKYQGNIYTFDLDKTYLDTEFETLSGLMKIPFESAEAKRNIPGVATLTRELRRGTKSEDYPVPLYFISGSPNQLENVIREKLKLDGVTFDGILFKDFTAALKKFNFKLLIDKIGFKLAALLYARSIFPPKANEFLFGDDSEYDSTIYSLYADIISGRLEDFEVLTILKKWEVNEEERELIKMNLERLKDAGWKNRDAVKRIFIHLEMGSSPNDQRTFSSKVTSTRNYYQTSVILYKDECISRAGLLRLISDLIRNSNFQLIDFSIATEDLLTRNLIDYKDAKRLLKLVARGNPLALPIQWISDLRREFNMLFDNVKIFKPLEEITQPKKEINRVEKYLAYVPNRKI